MPLVIHIIILMFNKRQSRDFACRYFDLFVHHAPPLKRRFLPRLHNTERELEKDLELSKRTRRVERDVEGLLASFRSLRHRGEGLHDSDSDDDHKRAAR